MFLAQAIHEENIQCIQHNYEEKVVLIYCVDCFVLGERGNRFFVLSFLCLLAPVVYVPWTLVFFQSFLRYILTLFAHRKYKAKC